MQRTDDARVEAWSPLDELPGARDDAALMLGVTLGDGAGAVEYELESDVLTTRRSSGEALAVNLSDITEVRLSYFDGFALCELHRPAGLAVTIGARRPEDAGQYVRFVQQVHEALASRSRPPRFVTGSWLLPAIIVVVSLAMIAVAVLIHSGIVPAIRWRISSLVGAAMAMVLGPVAFVRARPKTYSPRDLPRSALPMVR